MNRICGCCFIFVYYCEFSSEFSIFVCFYVCMHYVVLWIQTVNALELVAYVRLRFAYSYAKEASQSTRHERRMKNAGRVLNGAAIVCAQHECFICKNCIFKYIVRSIASFCTSTRAMRFKIQFDSK